MNEGASRQDSATKLIAMSWNHHGCHNVSETRSFLFQVSEKVFYSAGHWKTSLCHTSTNVRMIISNLFLCGQFPLSFCELQTCMTLNLSSPVSRKRFFLWTDSLLTSKQVRKSGVCYTPRFSTTKTRQHLCCTKTHNCLICTNTVVRTASKKLIHISIHVIVSFRAWQTALDI